MIDRAKSQKIRLIYAVFLAVFTLAIGIAIICVAADIYYSGKGTDVIYSREIVGERLEKLAIPLLFYLATVIAGVIFPIYEVKGKAKTSEDAVKRLAPKMPLTGMSEEYANAEKEYHKYAVIRNVAWIIAIAFAFASAVASLCYLADMAHFSSDTKNDMLELVKLVLPLTISSLALIAAASIVNGIVTKKQADVMHTMIKLGEGEKGESAATVAVGNAKAVLNNRITVWTVRAIVLIIGVAFVIAGALNGGAQDVLIKAINICQECIGLG